MIRSRVRGAAKRLLNGRLLRFRGPTEGRRIALTFDDGPFAGKTDAVLAVLRERVCPATFFVLGENAERAPHLLRTMREQGCEIGNHSWSHPDFNRLSPAAVADEIQRTEEVVRKATGSGSLPFRPPWGALPPHLLWHLFRTGRLPPVLWSACPGNEDRMSSQEIVADLRKKALSPGEIVLLHDDSAATLGALPEILDLIAERNLTPVTLSGLLRPA
ncbi:MAG: polysaccharide deacetylase family protein [Myxococcales bacterium]|nr:polysaccharide deacetylase family protein [Myxococcales bacterium]